MQLKIQSTLSILLWSVGALAHAGDLPATLTDCAAIADNGRRLVCYDRLAASSGHPELTILDLTFQQVGGFIDLAPTNINWAAVGGTTGGFLCLYNGGATVFGTFVPTTGSGNALADAGAPADGGDAGAASLATFSFPSNAGVGQAISDDTGGAGGMGAVLLESNGANFVYVTADGSKHFVVGTVLTSANGAEVAIANYHGSFTVSLYDRVVHSTQMIASGCP